jgi:lipoyl(octanoyl) transferase
VVDLGLMPYAPACKLQRELVEARKANAIPDVLLFCEHPHVITLGRNGKREHLRANDRLRAKMNVELHSTDRGGDITYHGPGQIVGYPILDLHNYFLDIHRYLRSIEDVIIRTLETFGIAAEREKEMTGVWVRGEKIAAIGVKVSRWVTMHGFAININTDLTKFGRIIPCGIFHKGVTSAQQVLGKEVPLGSVQSVLVNSFADVFQCRPLWIENTELNSIIMKSGSHQQKELSLL